MASVADIDALIQENQLLRKENQKNLDKCILLSVELSRIQAMLDSLNDNETFEM